MVRKNEKKITRRRVVIRLEDKKAKKVTLMGDFNSWEPDAHPMKAHETGEWKKHLFLSPGRYEYKFVVDGQWWEDPAGEQKCPNRFGTCNSVVTVEDK